MKRLWLILFGMCFLSLAAYSEPKLYAQPKVVRVGADISVNIEGTTGYHPVGVSNPNFSGTGKVSGEIKLKDGSSTLKAQAPGGVVITTVWQKDGESGEEVFIAQDTVFIYGVSNMDVWDSDNRHASDNFLQVVPPKENEDISGEVKIVTSDDIVLPDDFPKWIYIKAEKVGAKVTFEKSAPAWLAKKKILKHEKPHTTNISCENLNANISVYPYDISQFDYSDVQINAYFEAVLKTILEFTGKDVPKIDLSSNGLLRNQWKEVPGSCKAVWIYYADLNVTVVVDSEIDISKFTGIKAVIDWIKKKLSKKYFKAAEVAFYISVKSNCKAKFTFEKTIEGKFNKTPDKPVTYPIVISAGGNLHVEPKDEEYKDYITVEFKVGGSENATVTMDPWANDSGFGLNCTSKQKTFDLDYAVKVVLLKYTLIDEKKIIPILKEGNILENKNFTIYNFD